VRNVAAPERSELVGDEGIGMKMLLSILAFGLFGTACAQQSVQPAPPSLSEQIVQAEQHLESLRLSYTNFHPDVIVAERAIWQLENKLPERARSSALTARLVAEQQRLASLVAGGKPVEDSAALRLSRDRLRYLQELLATEAD
jgi:hypothetical protein